MSETPPATPSAAFPSPGPQDADDTRGKHFGTLARHPATIIITLVLAIAAFVGLSLAVNPALGAAGAAVAVLLVAIVVFSIAASRAESDFFTSYSQARGLQLNPGQGVVPPLTPLLVRGDARYTEPSLSGALPGGLTGTLALYTIEDQDTDSEGHTQTTYTHFTIVVASLPETGAMVSELFCQRRAGFRFMDGMEDVFRTRQRVELESAEADRRFEIFIGRDDDMTVARQVFSPSFVVWLAESASEDFAFELVGGALVCNLKGHKKSTGELDTMCEASAAVARRLRDEAVE